MDNRCRHWFIAVSFFLNSYPGRSKLRGSKGRYLSRNEDKNARPPQTGFNGFAQTARFRRDLL